MRKTKIVCTIGPTCSDEKTIEQMCKAGMNVARLNFSHGTHEDHQMRIDSIKKNAPVANVEDQTVENFEVMKHPKFEMYQDKAGEYRFRLKATNGQIIAVSEGYVAKTSCVNGLLII